MDAIQNLTYGLSYRDVVDIMKIIDESACRELHLEIGDFKLDLVKGPAATVPSEAPSPGASPAAPQAAPNLSPAPAPKAEAPAVTKADLPPTAAAGPSVSRDPSCIEIATPLTGVFYRAPAPGAPPFVEVGRTVEAGDQVAIVEVMKLMNSIKAPRKGKIRKILVPNETLVNMGQVLMILDPDQAAAQK